MRGHEPDGDRSRSRGATLVIGARILASLCLLAATPAAADPAAEAHAIFDDYWEFLLREDPVWATYIGDHRHGDRLQDLSEPAHQARVEALEGFLARSRALDRSSLDDADRLSVGVFERSLGFSLEEARLPGRLLPMNQQSGPHISFPQIIESQPFDTVEHCDAYVARLRRFPEQIDQTIANMRTGMREGIVAYRVAIERAIPQVRALMEGRPADHVVAAVRDRMEKIEPKEGDRIAGEVAEAVSGSVIPAYAKLATFLETEYLPACRTVPGIHALPGGDEWYAHLVRRHTTTELDPRTIHELGVAEMERILGEMNAIRERVGFSGDLPQFFAHLRTDPAFYHESPETLLDAYRDILAAMDRRLPELFGRLPTARCDLKEIESYRAEAAPAAYYYGPPDDGSRPAYFYVNTWDLPSRPRYTMAALAYHEAVPGHHLQIAIQQELDLPDFRRHEGFTAYVEGWALYAERLAGEVGGYPDDYAEFGRLTFEAWRAARLVVDTGVHAFGWSREQAIEYMMQNVGLSEHDVIAEVDRYIAWPGQALAYKLGELEIRKLRAEAERALGPRFDLRAFHDALLEQGALPLDLLRARVERWVAETQEGQASR
jgi:prolyl oligopeptidase